MTNVYFKENSESKKFIAPTKFRKKNKVDTKSQEDIQHEGGDEDQNNPNGFH